MSQAEYAAMVAGMVRANVPEARAIARARELFPDVAKQLDVQAERKAGILETREQLRIKQIGTVARFKVYSLSQPRRTKQTPGLPDLWLVHRDRPLAFWWETKRQKGGRHSDEQSEFAQECQRTNTPYGTGDRYHFADYLRSHGIEPPAIPID